MKSIGFEKENKKMLTTTKAANAYDVALENFDTAADAMDSATTSGK